MTTIEAPRTTRVLRDYQITAAQRVREEWAKGNNRTAIVHATGLGKTDIIAKLATDEALTGGHVLLIAHRNEPLDQMTKRCQMYAPDVSTGRVQAEENETDCQITVASVQTLSHPKRLTQLRKPTLLIIDETHHAMAISYQKIMLWAGCFESINPTRTLGVTATLVRGDKRGFGQLFQSIADELDIRWAVQNGWLVKPFGRPIPLPMALHTAKARRGDYVDSDTGQMVAANAHSIVSGWLEHGGNRITVVFTPTKAAASHVLAAFQSRHVPAELVVGTTSHEDRDLIYKRLATGETRVLVSVMVTTEAWDCPPVSCVVIARPTQNQGLYIQMVGRGLRLFPEGEKKDCLVLDVVGVQCDPRLVTLPDMYPSALYIRTNPVLSRLDTYSRYQYFRCEPSLWTRVRKFFRREN